jgi:hypothetical protein
MTYRDIIREMKSRGHYSDAESFERGLERNHCSEYDHVYCGNEADGMAHTYTGDLAEEAARELRWRERREQERVEEEQAMEIAEHERQCQARREAAEQEEAYWEHVNQQEQTAAEREQQ